MPHFWKSDALCLDVISLNNVKKIFYCVLFQSLVTWHFVFVCYKSCGHLVSLNHGRISTYRNCVLSSAVISGCNNTSCPLPQFAGHTILWIVVMVKASYWRRTSYQLRPVKEYKCINFDTCTTYSHYNSVKIMESNEPTEGLLRTLYRTRLSVSIKNSPLLDGFMSLEVRLGRAQPN